LSLIIHASFLFYWHLQSAATVAVPIFDAGSDSGGGTGTSTIAHITTDEALQLIVHAVLLMLLLLSLNCNFKYPLSPLLILHPLADNASGSLFFFFFFFFYCIFKIQKKKKMPSVTWRDTHTHTDKK
jgi:hypothetical protein